jgi:hypothetical protein
VRARCGQTGRFIAETIDVTLDFSLITLGGTSICAAKEEDRSMIKLKSLRKKLLRLEASIQKDAKKLTKLRRKVETALRAESVQTKVKSPARVEEPFGTARISVPVVKRRSGLTPAGRDKLSALMKARWASKRARAASNAAPVGEPHPAGV